MNQDSYFAILTLGSKAGSMVFEKPNGSARLAIVAGIDLGEDR